jgi:hypothetical protein
LGKQLRYEQGNSAPFAAHLDLLLVVFPVAFCPEEACPACCSAAKKPVDAFSQNE